MQKVPGDRKTKVRVGGMVQDRVVNKWTKCLHSGKNPEELAGP